MPHPTLGSLPKDQNGISVQIGSTFSCSDASATPKTSPLTLTGTIVALVAPDNAVELILNPAADLNISTDSLVGSYDVVAAGTKESVPCGRQDVIYVQGTGNLNFRFTIV